MDSTHVDTGGFPLITHPHYRVMEELEFPGELISSAQWVDSQNFICLTVSPKGARVWTCDYATDTRSILISQDFMNRNLVGFPECSNLSWKLSPSRNHIFFYWTDNAGFTQWKLLDISEAPDFRSRSFKAPGNMRISDVLFSADERYALFINDSFIEGSDVSILVIDLLAGEEFWRLSTHDVSFLKSIWWSGDNDSSTFQLSAELLDGEFHSPPVCLELDLDHKLLSPIPDNSGLMMKAVSVWGQVRCFSAVGDQDTSPYYLSADIEGLDDNRQMALSDAPLSVECLKASGLALVMNSAGYALDQLWLIDLVEGDKRIVTRDCDSYSIGSNGLLIVNPRGSNQLQVMQLQLPKTPEV